MTPKEFESKLQIHKCVAVIFTMVVFAFGVVTDKPASIGDIAICVMLLGIMQILCTIGKRMGDK